MLDEDRYILFDYVDGWVGVRCEPENQERADAMKASIPADDRKYLATKRLWIFKPRYIRTVVHILDTHCPGYPVLMEEKHADLIKTLILGPAAFTQPPLASPPVGPRAIHVGTLTDLRSGW